MLETQAEAAAAVRKRCWRAGAPPGRGGGADDHRQNNRRLFRMARAGQGSEHDPEKHAVGPDPRDHAPPKI
jgi:hypothetical protein